MYKTRWWFQIFFIFHPYLGKILILTNMFQRGWNHQLENQFFVEEIFVRFFCLKKVQALWVELLLWFTSPHQLVVARFEIRTKEETGRSPQKFQGKIQICEEFVMNLSMNMVLGVPYLKIMRGAYEKRLCLFKKSSFFKIPGGSQFRGCTISGIFN